MEKRFMEEAKKLSSKIIKIRRQIHMYPELGYQEKRTSELVAKTLRELNIEVKTGVAKTGVVGLLKGAKRGRTVGVRADMDALPITEQTQVPHRSRVEGLMHACGHDGNTATVLGMAMILADYREHFAGNVKFIFQPSEEAPPGGAKPMIEEGVLERPKVDAMLGFHVDPSIQVGKFGVRYGPMTAASDDFQVTVIGEASHGAKPHMGVDAITLAAQVILAIQTIPSRRIDPLQPVVITLGTVAGGYRQNVIADRVKLEGTARTLNERVRRRVVKLLRETIAGVTKSGGGSFEFEYEDGYPVFVAHDGMSDILSASIRRHAGKRGLVEIPEASMGGDDFAYFGSAVPGTMLHGGTGNKGKGIVYPWHHPKFDVDEDGLWMSSAILADAAVLCLSDEGQEMLRHPKRR